MELKHLPLNAVVTARVRVGAGAVTAVVGEGRMKINED
jgi:hypothetical protein